ncbi:MULTISPECIES: MmgE/PrpD family protein [unclassified Chelatococcus]|uniref:MmgE/PrpD family protein n=1 Tax=unclassified Chelatococcus TaxID=2638111 RepID=UPI001BCA70F5|nr:MULTISPECIES: MmgE/PrpD family protein [unclassified Chelatococcus]MBS7701552.1 MmgE/PrpD family protein [Chelatococcus sp. YT9]MBX3557387.1 MmgE/PrpD family protein [Chelatococcus sp.]
MSLTQELVRLARGKAITPTDLEAAAYFVLDTLACAVGARGSAPARMLDAVAPLGSTDPGRRAFFVGGLSHILEMDDLHRDSVTHPGCVVVPAAWAIAEDRNLKGQRFLESILSGYEAVCRVGMAVGKAHYRVWHNTSTCGPFGSAMAAADLMMLSEKQTIWSLGNAGTQSSGLWEFLEEGAMSKHLHTARASESGVLAALLAAENFTGPAHILEGKKGFFAGLCSDFEADKIVANPDGPWQLTRTSIKPWPCCRHTHPAIDAAIQLHRELDGEPITHVTVGAYRAALEVCNRPDPQDPYSAKFSLQHCVAIALADGQVMQSSFEGSSRERISDLRNKVSVDVSPVIDAAYPQSWGTEVVVKTAGGRKLAALRQDAKGDPENPVTSAELASKARGLIMGAGVSEQLADTFILSVLDLVNDRPVRDIALLETIRGR